jgi:hypothetical protein
MQVFPPAAGCGHACPIHQDRQQQLPSEAALQFPPGADLRCSPKPGRAAKSDRGLIFAAIKINWWGSHIHNLEQEADATHLALYLSDDIFVRTDLLLG